MADDTGSTPAEQTETPVTPAAPVTKPQSQQKAPSAAQRRAQAAAAVKPPVKTEDTVVLATPTPTPAPVVEAPAEPAPVEVPVVEAASQVVVTVATPAKSAVKASLEIVEGDDAQVINLKTQLAAFCESNSNWGETPEDYKQSAKLILQITKYVLQFPKVDVLDAFLTFFEENADGVCAGRNYLKGTSTLSQSDERLVGYLHALFLDLAHKNVVPINPGMVTQVLKKPEIANYYSRRISALVQSKR